MALLRKFREKKRVQNEPRCFTFRYPRTSVLQAHHAVTANIELKRYYNSKIIWISKQLSVRRRYRKLLGG